MTPQQQFAINAHTLPERADLFNAAKPRLAVHSHILLLAGASEAEVIARTKERFAGRLEMGVDLMEIEIADENPRDASALKIVRA